MQVYTVISAAVSLWSMDAHNLLKMVLDMPLQPKFGQLIWYIPSFGTLIYHLSISLFVDEAAIYWIRNLPHERELSRMGT